MVLCYARSYTFLTLGGGQEVSELNSDKGNAEIESNGELIALFIFKPEVEAVASVACCRRRPPGLAMCP